LRRTNLTACYSQLHPFKESKNNFAQKISDQTACNTCT